MNRDATTHEKTNFEETNRNGRLPITGISDRIAVPMATVARP